MPQRAQQHRPPRPKTPDLRPSPSKRGYGAAWQKVRAAVLSDSPYCVMCQAEGRMRKATCVDHVLSLERGGTNDRENLQPLCHPCHSRKTVAVDGALGQLPRQ